MPSGQTPYPQRPFSARTCQRLPKNRQYQVSRRELFRVEGERLEIIPDLMGDMRHNTVVWMLSISTLNGSDVLFNKAHPSKSEVTHEERLQWIRDIECLEMMDAEAIIPGHQKPGMPFSASSYTFTNPRNIIGARKS